MSFAKLQKKIDEFNNPTVVGLDPDLGHIPPDIMETCIKEYGETLEAASRAVILFNMGIIDAVCDIVPAVKPQSAYYERLGAHGVLALSLTCEYAASKGMYIIIDAKRGDIGSTAEAYSDAYLGTVKVGESEHMSFNADALTVNTYLGSDGLKPFIETAIEHDKAIFALVKTSNPSAAEIQDKQIGNVSQSEPLKVYHIVGDLLEEISKDTIDEYGYSRAGAVVGATYPKEAELLRNRLKHTFFLVPGYGAQGGTAADAAYSFDKNGRGAVVNSSRGIIAAWKKHSTHFTDAARTEAIKMRDELRKVIR